MATRTGTREEWLLDRSPRGRYDPEGWPRRHVEYEPKGATA